MTKADTYIPPGDNELFLQTLINQSVDGIMVIDAEGVVQFANPAAIALFSALVDPLVGYTIGIPAINESVEILVPLDNPPRTIEMRASEITWQGEPAHLATLRDSTEQNQIKKQLKEDEEKYRLLFESSLNGYGLHEIILDENDLPVDYVFLKVNQAFEKETGLKAAKILNKKVTDVIPGIEKTGLIEIYGKVAQTGQATRFEHYNSPLDRHFIISVYSPKKGQFVTIFEDISEQIKAANHLRQNEEKFRMLFETMSQGVVYQNAAGEITSVNPAAERILGLSMDQMKGKTSMDPEWQALKRNGEPLPGRMHPAMVALRTGKPVENFIFRVYHPGRKDHIWLSVSATPQFHQGEEKPYQVFATFLEITDLFRVQKILEERLKDLRCLSNIGSALQNDLSIEALCRFTGEELVAAVEYPEKAAAIVELAGARYEHDRYSEDLPNNIQAPLQTKTETFGRVAVFYPEDQPFILPEELDLITAVAERLSLWYQQKQTQEQLQASENKFRNAIMEAPIPTMIYAEDGEIVTINKAWTEISGYSREELSNVSEWSMKAYGVKEGEVKQYILEKFKTEQQIDEIESTVITKDGGRRNWLMTSTPLETLLNGKQTAMTMARDITDQTQAEKEMQRYYNRIIGLREIDQLIGSTLDLNEVLDRITSALGDLMRLDSMSVMLLDKGQLEIIAVKGFEDPERLLGLTFPSKPEFPNYDVIEQMRPVTYPNISEAYPKFTQFVEPGLSGFIQSWLGVPLISQEGVIGMFAIDRMTEEAFTTEDIEIAMQFASRAAIAIKNAQLYDRTKQQLEQLESLRKIDDIILNNLNLDEVLLPVLGLVKEGLGIDAASILLYDEAAQQLGFERGVGFRLEALADAKINLGQGYAGQVALTREPVFIPEIKHNNDKHIYPNNLAQEGIRSYYGFPLIAKGKLTGVLEVFHRSKLTPDDDWVGFAQILAGQIALGVDNISLFNDLQQANVGLVDAYDATIAGWAKALELRDKETQGHSQRVVELSLKVAKAFGIDDADLVHFQRGAFLHDIGKMVIPDEILHKPGPLSDEEWVIMRQHPVYAYKMLKDIDYLKPALVIPHYHQERWDGSGYPEGLVGEAIPLAARIFAVVDVWDALTSDRPYRAAWSCEQAISYMKEQAGKEFDPEVVSIFFENLQAYGFLKGLNL